MIRGYGVAMRHHVARIAVVVVVATSSAGCSSSSPSAPAPAPDPASAPPPAPAPAPAPSATPEPAADDAAAIHAAETWLDLVDRAQYAESWDAAAAFFRGAVPKEQWASQVSGARGPLGAVRSRRRTSAQAATSLPGAPDGSYVVIQYESSFANKASAVETVTPMLDPDGQWRVSGYYIR